MRKERSLCGRILHFPRMNPSYMISTQITCMHRSHPRTVTLLFLVILLTSSVKTYIFHNQIANSLEQWLSRTRCGLQWTVFPQQLRLTMLFWLMLSEVNTNHTSLNHPSFLPYPRNAKSRRSKCNKQNFCAKLWSCAMPSSAWDVIQEHLPKKMWQPAFELWVSSGMGQEQCLPVWLLEASSKVV